MIQVQYQFQKEEVRQFRNLIFWRYAVPNSFKLGIMLTTYLQLICFVYGFIQRVVLKAPDSVLNNVLITWFGFSIFIWVVLFIFNLRVYIRYNYGKFQDTELEKRSALISIDKLSIDWGFKKLETAWAGVENILSSSIGFLLTMKSGVSTQVYCIPESAFQTEKDKQELIEMAKQKGKYNNLKFFRFILRYTICLLVLLLCYKLIQFYPV
jgi:hypothetical protein